MLVVDCDDFTANWYAKEKGIEQRTVNIAPALEDWMHSHAPHSLAPRVKSVQADSITSEPSLPPSLENSSEKRKKQADIAAEAIAELRCRIASLRTFAWRLLTQIEAANPDFMTLGQFLVMLGQLDVPLSRQLACRVFCAIASVTDDPAAKVPTAVFKRELASHLVDSECPNASECV